ncbi:MAG: alkaline phosphatase family protein [Gammaproteobacteria bacterium]|nr:alkaline phosphatase family protein [Gammaproteobacteria bacterium]
MILPDYRGGSIVNLMSSIEQAMGSDFDLYPPANQLPVAQLQECDSLILLVIDGLGYDYLSTIGRGSHLHAHLQASLTSVCPSTTSAAVPTFLTGVAPQQHAFTGWFTWFREMGTVLSVLPFQPRHGGCGLGQLGLTPGVLSDTGTMFHRLKARSHVVMPERIARSEFNLAFHEGASIRSYQGLGDFFRVIKAALGGSDERDYVYAYWPDFDSIAHSRGVGSPELEQHFAELDEAFGQFVRKMRGSGCRVIVTADHGFIDVPSSGVIQMRDHPELAAAMVLPLCGEQRFAYSYVHPDRRDFFFQYVESELSHAVELYSSAEIIEQGWFGHGVPHPELESRVGHYAMVMQPGYKIRDRVLGERPKRHIGVHGGVTPEEMYVPLIVVDC